MPVKENKTTDINYDKFLKERNAGQAMRDELSYLSGWIKAGSPEIAQQLEKILEQHGKNRVQRWF